MKRFTLADDWWLALSAHSEGTYVGALLRGNSLQADVLCCVSSLLALDLVRLHRGKRISFETGEVPTLLEPASATCDFRVWAALQRVLTEEFQVPVRLYLGERSGSEPVVIFKTSEVGG